MEKEKKEKQLTISLQDRDLEILRFCLEMKFSDIESISFKFFESQNVDMHAARKRIQKLEQGGYLKSVALLSGTTKKFYLTTPKGYREVIKNIPEESSPAVVTKLSVVTFEHDLGVLKIRRMLEKQSRAFNWRSERLLKKMAQVYTQSLKRDFLPDALFASKQEKVVALEFENKPKSESQLREKIFRLKALMEVPDAPFEACYFVASTDNLKKKIKKLTDLIPNRFIVHSVREIEELDSTYKMG